MEPTDRGAAGRGPAANDTYPSHEDAGASSSGEGSAGSQGTLAAPQAAPPPPPLGLSDLSDPPERRYVDLGPLGRGGVGEVRRALDRTLQRKVAIKTLRPEYADNVPMIARFIHEAQIVAQLQHPAIVPVYDLGRRPDGAWYISMSVIRGQDLDRVIRAFHDARGGEPLLGEYGGWSLRRLLDILRAICEAVGYAHAMGVVHRDLKPENVMVGHYGEVFVVDWGLAKVIGRPAEASMDSMVGEAEADWPELKPNQTRRGVIAGTPAYMSPEQARGQVEDITPRSDTWALGGILFTILYGRMPYRGSSREVLAQVRQAPPREPGFVQVPQPLVEIWRRAMSMDPAERFADGLEMAREIGAWIEGSRARELGRAMLEEAEALRLELERQRREAGRLGQQARAAVIGLRATDELPVKEAAWTLEEQAQAAADRVEELYRDIAARARGALVHAPELAAAHRFLAALYRERAEAAEAAGDERALRELLDLLREHDDGTHKDFLDAEGSLSLACAAPGARAQLYRYQLKARRLALVGVSRHLDLPLSGHRLPAGSYLAVVKAEGHEAARLPFRLGRGDAWTFSPPGGEGAQPLLLPRAGTLGAGDRLVAGGWCLVGGDAEAVSSLGRQRLWVDDFVLRDRPVTHGEYLVFLNDLVERGHERAAAFYVPRLEEDAEPIYRFDDKRRRWVLPAGGADVVIDADGPVVYVSWHDACAFCVWYSMRTGQPWRLPGELEREKAARGADGRSFPWGEHADPAFHCVEDSSTMHPGAPPTADFPVDESPYFVHGLAGGVREWCADLFRPYGPDRKGSRAVAPEPPVREDTRPGQRGAMRVVRGGAWNLSARWGRCASRQGVSSVTRRNNLGFRVARSLTREEC